MRVWRENELSDGWFPEGIDIVPKITAPLVAVAAVVLGILIVVAVARLEHRH